MPTISFFGLIGKNNELITDSRRTGEFIWKGPPIRARVNNSFQLKSLYSQYIYRIGFGAKSYKSKIQQTDLILLFFTSFIHLIFIFMFLF